MHFARSKSFFFGKGVELLKRREASEDEGVLSSPWRTNMCCCFILACAALKLSADFAQAPVLTWGSLHEARYAIQGCSRF